MKKIYLFTLLITFTATAMADWKTMHTGDLLAATGLVKWRAWDGTQFTDTTEQSANGLLSLAQLSADGVPAAHGHRAQTR